MKEKNMIVVCTYRAWKRLRETENPKVRYNVEDLDADRRIILK